MDITRYFCNGKGILIICMLFVSFLIPKDLFSQSIEGISNSTQTGVHGFSTDGVGVYGESDSRSGVFGTSISYYAINGRSTNSHGAYFKGSDDVNYADIVLGGSFGAIKVEGGSILTIKKDGELSFEKEIGTKINLYDDGSGIYGFGIASAELQIGTYDNTKHISFGHYSGPSRSFVEWMQINSSSLTLSSGAYVSEGGVWTNASSKEYKENIKELDIQEAVKAIMSLDPVRFNYKSQKEEEYIGFIAEDVPDLLATQDRKSLSPMDILSALTKVVQEQEKHIKRMEKELIEIRTLMQGMEK